MLQKHKQPSLEAGLLIVLLVISIFSIGFLSENKITGMAVKEEGLEKVSGSMVKVSGI